MGTPVCELESKYFIEGDAHARARKEREFPLWQFPSDERCNSLSIACISVIKYVIRSGQGVVHEASFPSSVPFLSDLLF
jgi:hypothetical protein